MKEKRFDANRNMESLDLVWVSRANASQRKGRAGRVRNGVAIHLFTKHRFTNHFSSQPVPEIHRVPLEQLLLRIKTLPNFHSRDVYSVIGSSSHAEEDQKYTCTDLNASTDYYPPEGTNLGSKSKVHEINITPKRLADAKFIIESNTETKDKQVLSYQSNNRYHSNKHNYRGRSNYNNAYRNNGFRGNFSNNNHKFNSNNQNFNNERQHFNARQQNGNNQNRHNHSGNQNSEYLMMDFHKGRFCLAYCSYYILATFQKPSQENLCLLMTLDWQLKQKLSSHQTKYITNIRFDTIVEA